MRRYRTIFLMLAGLAAVCCTTTKEELPDLTDVPTVTADPDADTVPFEYPSWMPDEMPLIAWRGVPSESTSVENYQVMKDCGINTNLVFFDKEADLIEALDVAESLNMYLIPRWSSGFFNNPDTYVPKYDSRPGLLSYLVEDEPSPNESAWQTAVTRMENLAKAGATKPGYINLVGYGRDWTFTSWGMSGYPEYLDICVETFNLPYISFDYYPLKEEDGETYIAAHWYQNMQMIREASLKHGKVFWATTMSSANSNSSCPTPTVGHFRLQANVDLAYGAQAIAYFMYWEHESSSGSYHDYPVDSDGNPQEVYYSLKQANEEVRAVEQYFYKGRITKVVHFEDEFEGVTVRSSRYGAVGSLLISPAGDEYVVVVNKDWEGNMTFSYDGVDYELEEGQMKLLPR